MVGSPFPPPMPGCGRQDGTLNDDSGCGRALSPQDLARRARPSGVRSEIRSALDLERGQNQAGACCVSLTVLRARSHQLRVHQRRPGAGLCGRGVTSRLRRVAPGSQRPLVDRGGAVLTGLDRVKVVVQVAAQTARLGPVTHGAPPPAFPRARAANGRLRPRTGPRCSAR